MLVWTLIIVAFAFFGLTGYFKGAVRSLVSLLGVILGVWLAFPLAPQFKPLVVKLGFTHPFEPPVLAPIFVFLLFILVFFGLGFLAHWLLKSRYQFAMDDYMLAKWDRLNRRLGLVIGLIAAFTYSIIACLLIYIFGYPAVPFTTEGSPGWQKLLKTARVQLYETKMDRCVASLDPMPHRYYDVVDVLALIYHNPSVYERLANYPPFLEFQQMQEFRDLATDTQILGTLQTQGPVLPLLSNPKILAILNNQTIMNHLAQVDLSDLYTYLMTGKSPKYADQPILGKWKIDIAASYVAIRRKQPDMSVRQMRMVKLVLTLFLPKLEFMATPSKKAILKLKLTGQAQQIHKQMQEAIQKAQEAMQQAMGPYGYGAEARRYGLMPPAGQEQTQQKQTKVPLVPPVPGMLAFDFNGTGTWTQIRNGRYRIRIKDTQGRTVTGIAEFQEKDLLRIEFGDWVLIFYPALYRL